MTSKDNLVARARTAVVRRLDPVAAKRAATLAERRTNGIEATPEVAAALDATAALAVRDLAQRIRSGELDAHDQAALAQLVEAYLSEHPAESLPHGVAQAVASSFEGLWQPVGEPVNEPRAVHPRRDPRPVPPALLPRVEAHLEGHLVPRRAHLQVPHRHVDLHGAHRPARARSGHRDRHLPRRQRALHRRPAGDDRGRQRRHRRRQRAAEPAPAPAADLPHRLVDRPDDRGRRSPG